LRIVESLKALPAIAVPQAALEDVVSLIQELPAVIDAIASLVPAIVKMLIYFSVAALVMGIFAAIVHKIKTAGAIR